MSEEHTGCRCPQEVVGSQEEGGGRTDSQARRVLAPSTYTQVRDRGPGAQCPGSCTHDSGSLSQPTAKATAHADNPWAGDTGATPPGCTRVPVQARLEPKPDIQRASSAPPEADTHQVSPDSIETAAPAFMQGRGRPQMTVRTAPEAMPGWLSQ